MSSNQLIIKATHDRVEKRKAFKSQGLSWLIHSFIFFQQVFLKPQLCALIVSKHYDVRHQELNDKQNDTVPNFAELKIYWGWRSVKQIILQLSVVGSYKFYEGNIYCAVNVCSKVWPKWGGGGRDQIRLPGGRDTKIFRVLRGMKKESILSSSNKICKSIRSEGSCKSIRSEWSIFRILRGMKKESVLNGSNKICKSIRNSEGVEVVRE